GRLTIDSTNDELIYEGPNVMLGYALSREDLALGDELKGVLRTGDVGWQDHEAFFYVTGRLKRFIKLAGNRISLDEVEQLLQRELKVPAAVGGRDERMLVWLEAQDPILLAAAKQLITGHCGIHHSLYQIKNVDQLPLLPTGKKDYTALMVDA